MALDHRRQAEGFQREQDPFLSTVVGLRRAEGAGEADGDAV